MLISNAGLSTGMAAKVLDIRRGVTHLRAAFGLLLLLLSTFAMVLSESRDTVLAYKSGNYPWRGSHDASLHRSRGNAM
jgi:hypothetical protein